MQRAAQQLKLFFLNRLSKQRRTTEFFLLLFATTVLIVVVASQSLSRELNLALGGLLFICIFVLPLRFGYLGMIVACSFALTGVGFTLGHWVDESDYYYLGICVFQVSSSIGAVIVAVLSERDRRQRDELEHAAIVDGMTGLYNQRHFVVRIQQELAHSQRSGESLSLMYVDLDNFKPINDNLGHIYGDRYLRSFAAVLQDVVRAHDTVYRLGGDEFAVILPATNETGANAVAVRLKEELNRIDFEFPSAVKPPTASVGISVAPTFAATTDELMTQADSALYHAKHAGRDQIKLYRDVFRDILAYVSNDSESLIWGFKSLLWSASARDRYTYHHSELVSDFSAAIASGLGLPPDEVAALRVAGILHDLGRVQIPQEILLKSGPLNQQEWDLVKEHPIHTGEILSPLAGIGSIVDDVVHHHEHWNGSGYPNGLSGESIPVGSRIIAVADAFAAMCAERPYRAAIPPRRALEELKKAAGTKFDPKIVEIALQVLPELVADGVGSLRFGDLVG